MNSASVKVKPIMPENPANRGGGVRAIENLHHIPCTKPTSTHKFPALQPQSPSLSVPWDLVEEK